MTEVMESLLLLAQALHGLLASQAERQRRDQEGTEKPVLRAIMQLHHFAQRAVKESSSTALLEQAIQKATNVLFGLFKNFSTALSCGVNVGMLVVNVTQVLDDSPAAKRFLEGLDDPQQFAKVISKQRDRQVDDEIHELRHLMSNDRSGEDAATIVLSPGQASRLEHVIRKLRKLEQSVDHQAELAHCIDQATSVLHYSDQNYAYGSTPFCSWAKVVCAPEVQQRLQGVMQKGHNYMVWGSSCGWLVFFASITMGWPSIGYELLPCLHHSSESLRNELGLSPEEARFVCADMLGSSLSSTGVLLMANQCWDRRLSKLAVAKAVAELPMNALCIEYTGELAGTQMRLVACVSAPVSWKPSGLLFHVWVKE